MGRQGTKRQRGTSIPLEPANNEEVQELQKKIVELEEDQMQTEATQMEHEELKKQIILMKKENKNLVRFAKECNVSKKISETEQHMLSNITKHYIWPRCQYITKCRVRYSN